MKKFPMKTFLLHVINKNRKKNSSLKYINNKEWNLTFLSHLILKYIYYYYYTINKKAYF